MARVRVPVKRNSDVQYLNVDLQKDNRDALLKWLESDIDLFDAIEKAIDTGLKFGASWDAYNECTQAQFTKLPQKAGELTVVLVGRGGDLTQAMQALIFKYQVILQGELLEDTDRKNQRGVTDWS